MFGYEIVENVIQCGKCRKAAEKAKKKRKRAERVKCHRMAK